MSHSERPKAKGRKSGNTPKKDPPDEYEGEFSKTNKREGRGVCRFAHGDVYDGEWKAGKMDGRGIYKMADGDVYEGCWKGGQKDGPGTYWYASGRADVVTFKNGQDMGEGARWSVDRQMAWRLQCGEVVDEISPEEAQAVAERIGEPVPPQVSAASPLLRATGSVTSPATPSGQLTAGIASFSLSPENA
jgi:hypothetical protein